MGLAIGDGALGRRIVEKACGDARGELAAQHVVDPRQRHASVAHGRRQRRAEVDLAVVFLSGFLVEAGERRLDRRMDAAPVRQDPAGEAPISLQDIGQQMSVLRRPGAVDTVVARHHGAGTAGFERDLEGEQVALARRRFGKLGAVHDAPVLLIVEGEVLQRADDLGALHAADVGAGDDPGQKRVLGHVFEVASAARLADQVGAAAEHHAQAARAGLRADRGADLLRKVWIEAGAKRRTRRHRGRVEMHVGGIGDAEAGVGLFQRRYPEARHARRHAGRHQGVGRRRLAAGRRAEARVEEGDLLVEGHRGDEARGALRGARPTRSRFGKRRGSAGHEQRGGTQEHRDPHGPRCSRAILKRVG